MEPLDLSKAPPRSPREELEGLPALPRTIDKIRATLPGGNLGPYNIKGLSATMLETIGVTEEQFREAVARAKDDDEVAAWLSDHADKSKYPQWAQRANGLKVADVRDPDAERFAQRYPSSKSRPDSE